MNTRCISNCKAILLDFGGTLDSDGEHWLDRFYDLYEMVGLDLPREEIKRVFYLADDLCCKDPAVDHLGLRQLMKHHVHLQFSALKLDHVLEQERMVEVFCSKTERYLQRNAGLLARLKLGHRLGVVSNFYGNVKTLCEEAGLALSLDLILDSVKVGFGKPDPRIFELALHKISAAPAETVFVGDSYERDMVPARKLGMKTIWLKGPHPRLPEDVEPTDCVISSLAELESLAL